MLGEVEDLFEHRNDQIDALRAVPGRRRRRRTQRVLLGGGHDNPLVHFGGMTSRRGAERVGREHLVTLFAELADLVDRERHARRRAENLHGLDPGIRMCRDRRRGEREVNE